MPPIWLRVAVVPGSTHGAEPGITSLFLSEHSPNDIEKGHLLFEVLDTGPARVIFEDIEYRTAVKLVSLILP
jgi:hypothetical protein